MENGQLRPCNQCLRHRGCLSQKLPVCLNIEAETESAGTVRLLDDNESSHGTMFETTCSSTAISCRILGNIYRTLNPRNKKLSLRGVETLTAGQYGFSVTMAGQYESTQLVDMLQRSGNSGPLYRRRVETLTT